MIIEIGPNAFAMDQAGLAEFLDILDQEIADAKRDAAERDKVTKLMEEGDDGKF